MRVTTFSVAAILLVAAALAIVWPARNAGPGVAAVLAQEPPAKPRAAAVPDPFGAPAGDPFGAPPGAPAAAPGAAVDPFAAGPPANRPAKTLTDKLNQKRDYQFIETPLKDAFQILGDTTGIQFVVNVKRLEEVGVNIDTPVTKNLTQVRLSTFLDLLLEDLELVYVERDDDLIMITTPRDAANTMEVRVYDCRDLLELANVGPEGGAGVGAAPGPGLGGPLAGGVPGAAGGPALAGPPGAGGGGLGPGGFAPGAFGPGGDAAGGGAADRDGRAARLTSALTTAVDPPSWTAMGGSGTVTEFGGLLVISQSARTHKKVEHVLDMLREAAGLEAGQAKKVVR